MRRLTSPATIGIIGGGQLGMMAVREAQRMGLRSIVWDPDAHCSASYLADETIAAPFEDMSAAERIAQSADVVTYEFENIDVRALESIGKRKNVFPGAHVLRVTQNRAAEKQWLQEQGFAIAEFRLAQDEHSLRSAVEALGMPVVVKTVGAGYDGKGQTVLRSDADVARVLATVRADRGDYVVERFVELGLELSVIVAREQNGTAWTFPPAVNGHRNNILHTSIAPAPVEEQLILEVETLGRRIAERLNVVGLVCVEMFLTTGGELLVNELAPRPHNSGHYSIEGCSISQFEALVRIVTGIPMQAPVLLHPTGIVNVLGQHVEKLDIDAVLGVEGTRMHWYNKGRVANGRKMGHVSVVAETPYALTARMNEVEKMIGERSSDFSHYTFESARIV